MTFIELRLERTAVALEKDIAITTICGGKSPATQPIQETNMTDKQSENARTVPVIEADVLDEMTETNSLIAQRAYEIYESRSGRHGDDQEDWFTAEQEILPDLEIDYDVSDREIRFTAHPIRFGPDELEVIIGHQRAVICGIHPGQNRTPGGSRDKWIMRIIELPFAVDPVSARATLYNKTLQVVLPRMSAEDSSSFSKAAGA
jgi:HSP20 family molecular chaperone IbpA